MHVLPFERQVAAISALCEGMSIRATERLTDIHRDTIMRLGVRVGQGCDLIHDYYMRDLNIAVIELDELWAFIGKKRKNVKPQDPPELGDCYSFIAMDATNKAILSYRTGNRDGDTTEFFLADLRSRVHGSPVLVSDAFRFYSRGVQRVFKQRVHYGQIIKKFDGIPVMDDARRYSPQAVVEIERRTIYGKPPWEKITTSHVERQNLSVRMASRRFTRLTNGFSKKIENHCAAVGLYVAHYNFCRVHETIKTTPAMAISVTDHVWSIAELVEGALQGYVEPRGGKRRRFRVIDGGLP